MLECKTDRRTERSNTVAKLIDVDAVKAMIYEKIPLSLFMMRTIKGAQQSMGELRGMIDELPTIEAEPVRHGRWIKMTGMMPPEYHGHYECSECHWHMKGIRSSWTREEELTYCPNCGAIMDGGEDDISKETNT